MFKWFHRQLHPHCPECQLEEQNKKICDSCENLKYELSRLQLENERLLARILEKPEIPIDRPKAPELVAPLPRANTWAIRKAMLEAEDREKAKLLRNVPKTDVADLEKELEIATTSRESSKD